MAETTAVLSFQDGIGKTASNVVCQFSFDARKKLLAGFSGTVQIFNLKETTARLTKTIVAETEISYTLISPSETVSLASADVRGDELRCAITLKSNHESDIVVSSAKLTVADSLPEIRVTTGNVSQSGLLAGSSISALQLAASDPDGDAVTFVRESKTCDTIDVNPVTGLVTGTLPGATSSGSDVTCTLEFKAMAGAVKSASTVTLVATSSNNPPRVSCTTKSLTLQPGDVLPEGVVCKALDRDADAQVTYSASGCPGVSIDSNGKVSGSVGTAACTLTVTATDGQATQTDTIAIERPQNLFTILPQGQSGYNQIASNFVTDMVALGTSIYVATDGGLSISTDSGATFVTKTTANGLQNNGINRIVVDGANIYLATNAGLSISTDSGSTFLTRTTAHGLGSNIVNAVVVSGTHVYVATSQGVSISTDSGVTFRNATTENGLGNDVVTDVLLNGTTLFASTQGGGISISTDTGTTFSSRTTANGLGANDVRKLAFSSDSLYAATFGGGLSISTDGGANFATRTVVNASLNSNYLVHISVTGTNVYATSFRNGVSISANGGTSFVATSGLPTSNANFAAAFGSTLYVGHAAGISKSANNGTTFTTTSATAPLTSKMVDVHINDNKLFAVTNGGGISVSTDSGVSFVNGTTTGAHATLSGVALDGNAFYYSSQNGLLVSTDAGATFQTLTTTNGLPANLIYDAFAVGQNLYAATDSGLAISSDSGSHFSTKTTSNGLGNNSTRAVSVNGSSIFVGTISGLSLSTDSGNTFANKTTAHGLGSNSVQRVTTVGNNVYVATQFGLAVSTDNGGTFVNKTTQHGLPSNNVTSLFATGSVVYAGTDAGLAISSDAGSKFETVVNVGNGLPSNFITKIKVIGNFIFVATPAGLAIQHTPL